MERNKNKTRNPMVKSEITWVDPKERLPVTTCEVVVSTHHGSVSTVSYSRKYKMFNCTDSFTPQEAAKYNINDDVKYWAYTQDFPI